MENLLSKVSTYPCLPLTLAAFSHFHSAQASAFVGLLPMCDISIDIADAERRSRHTALKDGQPVTYLVFSGDDAVSGEVHFKFDTGTRRLDHVGIKVHI